MVYVFALITSLLNAVASILQRLGVEGASSGPTRSSTLVAHMVRRTVWIAGFGLMAFGYAAQAAALHLGSLAVVQPLLVTELVFVVMAMGLWYSLPLRLRDVAAAFIACAGLAGFLAVASPTAGAHVPSGGLWVLVIILLGAGVLVCTMAALRGPPWWRALSYGAGASVGFSLTAALTKVMTNNLVKGWSNLLESWATYGVIVVGLGSFLLMQHAFHAGPFTASQSTLVLVNPVVSIVIGAVLFHDHLRTGVGPIFLEVVALALTISATLALVRSPLVQGVHDEDDSRQLLVGKGLWARRHAPSRS